MIGRTSQIKSKDIKLRASNIETIFKLAEGLDTRSVFSAVGRFERYYANKWSSISVAKPEEITLTAIAALYSVIVQIKFKAADEI